MGRSRRVVLALVAVGLLLWAGNRPWSARPAGGRPRILAHRGMAQEYDREGLTGETCTAARMTPPRHPYLENTLDGVAAAFALGAYRVEIDVHPTTDGAFVVFHDWTLDCRTDGRGVTREHTLAELQALDVGYGYTADGGRTYPFRGRFVGAMPSLDQVLETFPEGRLLINMKSADPAEAEALARVVERLPPARQQLLAFSGHDVPMEVLRARLEARTLSKGRLKPCVLGYLALGWSGHVPEDCHHSVVYVPINVAPLLWGWDRLFLERMEAADAEVYAIGPFWGGWSDGLDDPEQLARLPEGYTGGISTDRIDLVAPRYDP